MLCFRKILIIDADETAAAPLCGYFGQGGCVCRVATTFESGRAFLGGEKFDAAICELALPDGSAAQLLETPGLPPVIVYSADGGDDDIVDVLSRGAADYVAKPCSPRVMAARIERRLPRGNTVVCHGLTLDAGMRSVSYRGSPVKLTSSEFNILRFLMSNPGRFFTADEIYEHVWNASSMQTSVVRFHISNLKKALLAVTGKNLILSEFGAGYAFAAEN